MSQINKMNPSKGSRKTYSYLQNGIIMVLAKNQQKYQFCFLDELVAIARSVKFLFIMGNSRKNDVFFLKNFPN